MPHTLTEGYLSPGKKVWIFIQKSARPQVQQTKADKIRDIVINICNVQ